MKRSVPPLVLATALALVAVGCAVDVPHLMKTDATMRATVLDTIAGDSTLTNAVVVRLVGAEGTRQALLDAVFANGDATQQAMMRVARDPTRLDGVLALAVQDSATKDHVLTLLKGMQMAGAK
jgi:hypothetical protein